MSGSGELVQPVSMLGRQLETMPATVLNLMNNSSILFRFMGSNLQDPFCTEEQLFLLRSYQDKS